MTPRLAPIVAAALLAAGAPAFAVGLGPLVKDGVTRGPNKAFFLELMNPYSAARTFRVVASDPEERPIDRVEIRPALATLGAHSQRRLVVIVHDLAPGEEYHFKVCAALANQPERALHARVCSKLAARRVAAGLR